VRRIRRAAPAGQIQQAQKGALAANPKSAMLITMNDKWFHWLMEKIRARSTSKARAENETRKRQNVS